MIDFMETLLKIIYKCNTSQEADISVVRLYRSPDNLVADISSKTPVSLNNFSLPGAILLFIVFVWGAILTIWLAIPAGSRLRQYVALTTAPETTREDREPA